MDSYSDSIDNGDGGAEIVSGGAEIVPTKRRMVRGNITITVTSLEKDKSERVKRLEEEAEKRYCEEQTKMMKELEAACKARQIEIEKTEGISKGKGEIKKMTEEEIKRRSSELTRKLNTFTYMKKWRDPYCGQGPDYFQAHRDSSGNVPPPWSFKYGAQDMCNKKMARNETMKEPDESENTMEDREM